MAALRCELLKARRSRVPPITALGFSLAPMMAGLFMIIMQDPERARRLGLIRAKAEIFAGTADWPTFLSVNAQAVAIGGSLLFALLVAWVFGREFADRTVKIVLAVPAPRWATVLAKLAVAGGVALLLSVWVLLLALAIGALIGLDGGSAAVLRAGVFRLAITAGLTVLLTTPVALIASMTRGYMAPLGFAVLMLFLAQITAATGWGAWFPWSVPALYSGLAGPEGAALPAASYGLIVSVSAAGLVGTLAWWRLADHST